jgi:hypothetical protein
MQGFILCVINYLFPFIYGYYYVTMSMGQTHNEIYSLPIVYKLGITLSKSPKPTKQDECTFKDVVVGVEQSLRQVMWCGHGRAVWPKGTHARPRDHVVVALERHMECVEVPHDCSQGGVPLNT